MKPTIGRIVHYVIGAGDAQIINKRRQDFAAFNRRDHGERTPGEIGATGHIGHVGNGVREGDIYPAMVVRDWNEASGCVNLKVELDGDDTYWATSRVPGDGPGTWHWPPRVEREPGDRPAATVADSSFRPDR